jgi:hypothetical protein
MNGINPIEYLQFGALGLCALMFVVFATLVFWFLRRLEVALGHVTHRLEEVSSSLLVLRDPSVRSYLDQLAARRERDTVP